MLTQPFDLNVSKEELVYERVYPEVHCKSGYLAPPVFPALCPVCGADIVEVERKDYRPGTTYACGGRYTHKPQIQNHTDKWWGHCGK